MFPNNESDSQDTTRCLNFSRVAAGSRLAARSGISLKSIIEELRDQSKHTNLAYFTKLDLSYCDIFDHDLLDVFSIIELLPECSILNLIGTSLNSPPAAVIQKFTLLPKLQYILISGTGLASINGRTTFSNLEKHDLTKIIFLESAMVLRDTWKTMIRNIEHQQIIVETHLNFFKNHSV